MSLVIIENTAIDADAVAKIQSIQPGNGVAPRRVLLDAAGRELMTTGMGLEAVVAIVNNGRSPSKNLAD